jgi:phosphate transport system permease protein
MEGDQRMSVTNGNRFGFGSGIRADALFRILFGSAVVVAGLLLLGVILSMVASSMPVWSIQTPLSFVFGDRWAGEVTQPDGSIAGNYGALPVIWGTAVSSLIAVLIAAPVGILAAVYLVEFAPRKLAAPLTFLVELMAAIPSVVIGLWAAGDLSIRLRDSIEWWVASTLGHVFPWLAEDPNAPASQSVFRAGMVLAIMIIPMVVAVSREVIRSVPQSLREGFIGMGATRWETIRHVVLPAARVGLTGAVLLALGRAIGETIAVTMVIGNAEGIPSSLFLPGQTIASKIASNYGEAGSPTQVGALAALGICLFAVTFLLSLAIRLVVRRSMRQGGRVG